jgi:hypothetical protein
MKSSFVPIHKIIIATIAGISFASMLVAESTLADSNQPFGSLESDRNSNNNPLSGNGGDFNMFNLIHQAQMGNIQWNDDQQNQQLDLAAAAFKAEQQKLLQTQTTKNPSNTPTTSNLNLNQNLLPLLLPLPSSSK